MITRVAGIWRYVKRLSGGDVAGFDMHRYTVQGGIAAGGVSGTRFIGAVQAWAFVATWNNYYPISVASPFGLQLKVEVEARAGDLEVALLARDGKTILARAEPHDGISIVSLTAPRALDVASLVVRSRRAGAVDIEVRSISSSLCMVTRVEERGFLAKDAIADLRVKIDSPEIAIVDVGANRGDTVASFLRQFPGARIWALEPHPRTFEAMASRFAQDERVVPRQLALSSGRGQSVMHSYSNAAINSLSPVAVDGERLIDGPVTPESVVMVDHLSLAEFFQAEGLDRVDVLKLDTQGHELEILEGQSQLLRSGQIRFILAELLFSPLYSKQARASQVMFLLEACGFKVFDFYDFVYDESTGLKWGDALFMFSGAEGQR